MHDFITLSVNLNNLDTKLYRIFDLDSRKEILHWFDNKNVPKEEKGEFIQALTSFDDKCGNFYYYRTYLFASEALGYFPECRMGDEIAQQVLKWAILISLSETRLDNISKSLGRSSKASNSFNR